MVDFSKCSLMFVLLCCAGLSMIERNFLVAQEEQTRAFADVFADFQSVNQEIEGIVKAHRDAGPAERPAIMERYNTIMEKMRRLIPELQTSAVAEYRSNPNGDPEVTKMLVSLIANEVQQDKYEKALEMGKVLVENNCENPALYSLLATAAYSVDDFESAESLFETASEAGTLSPSANAMRGDLEVAKAAWLQEQAIRAAEASVGDLPRVKMETSKGTVLIELYENEAPGAVGNFVNLVEKGFYDGLSFHRVLPGFMAQGGCPQGTGTGGPGYKIACECHQDNHRKHFRGTLSMAHAGRNTGGSQFFLTFKRTAHLDGRHTVFGRVIEGLDVLENLQRIDPQRANQSEPDKIVKAEVVRKRDHEYVPNRVK